ncbi:MAG: hypothetical protein HY042_06320, partial [Spirochaetia bacterium]|nr:hypothetical protein [Spirochaetia bacterium]
MSFIAMLLCAAEQARPEPLRLGASGLEVAGPHVQFLRGDISFEQALASSDWAPAGDKEPDFGFSNDVFWFRVDLDADQAAPYIFEVAASVTSLKA